MGFWEAIWKSSVLGVVQGLTEFLPVSSSGHLTLLQKLLGFDTAGGAMTFINIMMHLGTLIAVVIVFWKDIVALFRKPFKMLLMLIVATIPAGIIGLLFSDEIDSIFAGETGLLYLALCFALTALMLLVCEFIAKRQKTPKPLGWGNTVSMGLMQAVALFPGISRSGSTIVAGTVTGAKRKEVARFSFLMSIPIILGSFLVEIASGVKDVVTGQPSYFSEIAAPEIVGMVFGVVLSMVFGFIAIKWMMKIIQKANYMWFSVYLLCLSLGCFWLNALGLY